MPPRILIVLCIFFMSCSSAQERHREEVMTRQTRVTDAADDLHSIIEQRLSVRRDVDVEIALRAIALRVSKSSPRLREAPLGIFLIQAAEGLWQSAVLPDIRVYVSLPALKKMEAENEAAALIALELAHFQEKHLQDTLSERVAKDSSSSMETLFRPTVFLQNLNYFGRSGVLKWNRSQMQKSIQTATELLYEAGYDPRGLTVLWMIHQENSSFSPYSKEELKDYLRWTYQAIARFPPLRNPVVDSEVFVEVRKGIERL
jgi:predicted Zn-dependent protease